MRSLGKIIEAHIFKVRYVFESAYSHNDNVDEMNSDPVDEYISIEPITQDNIYMIEKIYEDCHDVSYIRRVEKYIENTSVWLGYVVRYNNRPAGCFWILVPNVNDVMHDSFMITTNEALLCGVYVSPSYRGNRIFTVIQKYAYEHVNHSCNSRKLLMIVEKSNHASLTSVRRLGHWTQTGVNVLIKLAGRNIISFYFPRIGGVMTWLVARR